MNESISIFFRIADAIPNPIYLLDADRRYRNCNRGFEQFIGLARDEIIGRTELRELCSARDDLTQGTGHESAENPLNAGRFETRYRNAEGKEFEIVVNFSGLSSNGVLEGTIGVITDISEIKKRQRELRRVSSMLNAVIQASPLPITMIDSDFYVRLWNPAAEKCFGYRAEEVIDKIYPLWPDSDEEQAKALKRLNHDEILYGMEVLRKKNDGAVIHVKRYTSPLRDAAGAVIGTMAVLEDLTEQKKYEAELLQASKMAAIGELASGIAHEINNPNSFIMTNAQFLSEAWNDISRILIRHADEHADSSLAGLSLPEALESLPALLRGLEEGSFRIQKIVETIKDFYRQEDVSVKTPVEIRNVVETSIFMLENEIKKHTYQFHYTCEENLSPIMGRFHQLEQVIINIMMNALQALQSRNSAISLTVTHNRNENVIEITVSDQGVGMTRETMDRILDPFYTTRLDRGGTGLGLSISHKIIREHGGMLRFESQPGQGTSAIISLPIGERSGKENCNEPE